MNLRKAENLQLGSTTGFRLYDIGRLFNLSKQVQ